MTAHTTSGPPTPSLTTDPEATLVDAAHQRPAESDPLVGTVVDGRYEVVALLGEGGMGRLYDVRHVVLEQRGVLKTILPKYARDPRVVARFIREARAASQIGNAHIVDVRDSGKLEDGRAYYVMEYLEGQDVRELLDDVALLDEAQAIDIAIQVLSALEAAHSAGLVHRDLKPENIFLTRDSAGEIHAKVVDFGLVRFTEITSVAALTKAGELVGTPHYMSPEQCRGAAVDIRSDLYSLGLVLYEMVTGEVPYEEFEFLQVVLHKTVDEWPPFGPLERLASPELCAVLCRCLVADPTKRLATPREMRASLEAVRSGDTMASGSTQLPAAFDAAASGSMQLAAAFDAATRLSMSGDVSASRAAGARLHTPSAPSVESGPSLSGVTARPASKTRRRTTVSPVRGALASALATFTIGAAVVAALLLVVAPCAGSPSAPVAESAVTANAVSEAALIGERDASALAPVRARPPATAEVPVAAESRRPVPSRAAPDAAPTTPAAPVSATARRPARIRRPRAARPAPEPPVVALPPAPRPSPAARPVPRSASERSGVLNPWN